MKAVVAAFNQEKALVGAFSVIVQLHRLIDLRHYPGLAGGWPAGWLLAAGGEGDSYGPAAGSPVLVLVPVHQARGLHVHTDLHGHNIEQAPAGARLL